ncbi:hypothetical protein ACSX1A_00525 [Pontibacter sp. MBLB2868]|uniref:hypothetical protein n=1 Tax=Pontibacter sp. MBLB2868 TaxID=3451555 RepID=UPI003F74FA97
MSALIEFLKKIESNDCDLIVLTSIGGERLYCRFFKGGLYKDRMFVNEENIMATLLAVCGEGEEIDASGVSRLRKMFTPA